MSDVTKMLSEIERGDESAAEQLLPLVYQELRKLAAAKLAKEKPGQTLQPTILVHEAYLRLVDVDQPQQWDDKAKLVKLKYFAGLTIPEASEAMGVSTATAERYWRFARAWLHSQLKNSE